MTDTRKAMQNLRSAWENHTGCEPSESVLAQAIDELEEALRSALAQQVEPYQDSTPELSVGDSSFESWYSTYPRQGVSKQVARDAYAAGMGDPLVTAHPGIDDAETICADFYKAMCDTLNKGKP